MYNNDINFEIVPVFQSSDVAGAAYESPWYTCSVRMRRSVLVVMSRTQRVAKINAGGFTTLSLASFMAVRESID